MTWVTRSIAHADPAADPFRGFFTTSLVPDELLSRIGFPCCRRCWDQLRRGQPPSAGRLPPSSPRPYACLYL